MKHLLAMFIMAALVAVVFAFVSNEKSSQGRLIVGVRTFGEFMGMGILLAWFFYFVQW